MSLNLTCVPDPIDLFWKRHRLVHNGRLPKFEALYGSLNMVNSAERYKVQSFKSQSKVLNQFKSYNSFWMYPPLWPSYLVAMHDQIENRSILKANIYNLQHRFCCALCKILINFAHCFPGTGIPYVWIKSAGRLSKYLLFQSCEVLRNNFFN